MPIEELNALFQERALQEHRIGEIRELRRKLKNRAAAARSREPANQRRANLERGIRELVQRDGLAAIRPHGDDIQGDIHERDQYAIGPFHEDIGLNNQGLRDMPIEELNALFQERALQEHRIGEIRGLRRKLKNRAAAARSRDVAMQRRPNQEWGRQELEDGLAALRAAMQRRANQERGIQELEDGLAALRPHGDDNDA